MISDRERKMGIAITNKGAKWPTQIPTHILTVLEQREEDYSLKDVIAICEESVGLDDQEEGGWRLNGMEYLYLNL